MRFALKRPAFILMRRKKVVLITTVCAAFVGFSVAGFQKGWRLGSLYYSRVIMDVEPESNPLSHSEPTAVEREHYRLRAERRRTGRIDAN